MFQELLQFVFHFLKFFRKLNKNSPKFFLDIILKFTLNNSDSKAKVLKIINC